MARAIDAEDVLISKNRLMADLKSDYAYAAMKIVDAQPTIEPKQEWISVKDRLPEECSVIEGGKHETCSDLVIVFVRDDLGNSFICDDMTANGEWINYPTPQFEVTHWMPLPEPPETE